MNSLNLTAQATTSDFERLVNASLKTVHRIVAWRGFSRGDQLESPPQPRLKLVEPFRKFKLGSADSAAVLETWT